MTLRTPLGSFRLAATASLGLAGAALALSPVASVGQEPALDPDAPILSTLDDDDDDGGEDDDDADGDDDDGDDDGRGNGRTFPVTAPQAPAPPAPTAPAAPTPAPRAQPGTAPGTTTPGPPAAARAPIRKHLLTPTAGRVVGGLRPLLRWRGGPTRVRLYNVQVFLGSRKVMSVFPRGRSVRIPAKRLAPGRRYVWRVWPYMASGDYTARPLGLSWFATPSRATLRARALR